MRSRVVVTLPTWFLGPAFEQIHADDGAPVRVGGDGAEVAEAVEECRPKRGGRGRERAGARIVEVEGSLAPVGLGEPAEDVLVDARRQLRRELGERDRRRNALGRPGRRHAGAGDDRKLEAVREREPDGMQEVGGARDRRPRARAFGAGGDPDADRGVRRGALARDLRAEVGQRDTSQVRVRRQQRIPERLLKRVDWAAAASVAAQHLPTDGDLRRGDRTRRLLAAALPGGHVVAGHLERRLVGLADAADEQLERRRRVLEVESLALELLHLRRDLARQRPVRVELKAQLAGTLDDVVLLGCLARSLRFVWTSHRPVYDARSRRGEQRLSLGARAPRPDHDPLDLCGDAHRGRRYEGAVLLAGCSPDVRLVVVRLDANRCKT
jgi:hypothetical protein